MLEGQLPAASQWRATERQRELGLDFAESLNELGPGIEVLDGKKSGEMVEVLHWRQRDLQPAELCKARKVPEVHELNLLELVRHCQ